MPLGQRSELWKLEEDPGPAQGLVEAQLLGAGEEKVPRTPSSFSTLASSQSAAPSGSCSALFLVPLEEGSAAGFQSRPQSSLSACPSPTAQAATACSQPDQGSSSSDEEGASPREEPEEAQPGLQNLLQGKLAELVEFLLLKYHIKEPTSQAEMLEIISQDALDAFLVILGQASECLQLVYGMDVKEVDPSDHSYILVPILGLTYDGMLSGQTPRENGCPGGVPAPQIPQQAADPPGRDAGDCQQRLPGRLPSDLGPSLRVHAAGLWRGHEEVDRSDHSYVLVNVLDLTYDGMLSGEHGVPKTSLLVLLLGVSLLHGNRAPEEEVWETLGLMGVYAGQEHIIYGEPRELSPKSGCRKGTWSTGRCLAATLTATSSRGVPGPMLNQQGSSAGVCAPGQARAAGFLPGPV